jgi:uncharacterized membrane protein YbhN (UPF0104 family)
MTKPHEPETSASETAPTARAQAPTQPTAAGGAQNTEPTTVEEADRTKSGIKLRHVLSALVSIGLVTLIFWKLLPQFASISDIWASIRDMTWLEVTTLGLAALWNLCTYWFVMVGTMPGLTYPQAAVVTESSTAVSNTVPAGGAIGIAMSYSMYDSWGFSRSRSSVSLLVSGIWNNFAKLGLPILALALLAFSGGPGGGRLIVGLAGLAALIASLVIFSLMMRTDELARRIGRGLGRAVSALIKPFRRPPVTGWDKATAKFRSRTILLLRARWHWITLATLVSHLSLYFVLLLSLRHIGVSNSEVSWIEVLVVFSFARLLTAIPFTPGGLGIVEAALIAGIASYGGDHAQVAAATLVFRALTYVLPIPIGVLTYLFWKRNRSWRRAPGAAPRTDLVPEST